MSKLQVMDSLLGEEVTILALDRQESEYTGELIEFCEMGAVLKYSSHGREFVSFIPMTNIDTISHKVLSA